LRPLGPDAIRKRRATANRVLTVLKAALNHAWREGRVPSDGRLAQDQAVFTTLMRR